MKKDVKFIVNKILEGANVRSVLSENGKSISERVFLKTKNSCYSNNQIKSIDSWWTKVISDFCSSVGCARYEAEVYIEIKDSLLLFGCAFDPGKVAYKLSQFKSLLNDAGIKVGKDVTLMKDPFIGPGSFIINLVNITPDDFVKKLINS